jgi:hypothetical protein
VGRLAILPVDHEHAFGLHLLIKGSGRRDFSIILRLHLELEPDLDCVGVVLAQTSSRKGKDLPIAWVEEPRNAGPRKLLRISSAIQKAYQYSTLNDVEKLKYTLQRTSRRSLSK